MACPLMKCGVMLQPLDPSTSYVQTAQLHAEQHGVDMPAHGPAILVWGALVVHHQVLHSQLDLASYLEAYLSQ